MLRVHIKREHDMVRTKLAVSEQAARKPFHDHREMK